MIGIVEKVRDALQGTFLKSAEEANEQTSAIKRRRKFTPSTLAQAFILALLQNPKASHDDIASFAAASGVDVSPPAVEQRYSPSLAAFFKALFEKMAKQIVASEVTLAPILSRFTEVILIDSSVIVLPDTRWQIELLFKRWKSYGRIDELDGKNDIVIMTRFWARLCAALIQHWLSIAATWSPTLTVSLAKTAKLVRQIAGEIASLLSSGGDLTMLLERFCRQARAGCQLTTRHAAPGTFQLLRDPELLEYSLT